MIPLLGVAVLGGSTDDEGMNNNLIPNTLHKRTVASAMTAAGWSLGSEDFAEYAGTKRAFEQQWDRGGKTVVIRYSRDGYVTSYSSGRAYAHTHAAGRNGRRGPWQPAFTPRNLLDMIVRHATTEDWIF